MIEMIERFGTAETGERSDARAAAYADMLLNIAGSVGAEAPAAPIPPRGCLEVGPGAFVRRREGARRG